MPVYISIVFIIALSILIALGLSELLRFLEKKVTTNKFSNIISIVPLKGHIENAEYIVRSLMTENRDANTRNIIIIDLGLDRETKEICNILCNQNPDIHLCAKKDLEKVISSELN